MGHLIAAAGAVEAAVCALAIHHGTLPVNANLREPDPDCDLDIVRGAAARATRPGRAVQLASASAARTAASPSATRTRSTARV